MPPHCYGVGIEIFLSPNLKVARLATPQEMGRAKMEDGEGGHFQKISLRKGVFMMSSKRILTIGRA